MIARPPQEATPIEMRMTPIEIGNFCMTGNNAPDIVGNGNWIALKSKKVDHVAIAWSYNENCYRINILYATLPLNVIPAHNIPVISIRKAIADPCIMIETSNVCSTGSGSGSDSAQNNTFTNTREAVWWNEKQNVYRRCLFDFFATHPIWWKNSNISLTLNVEFRI